MQNIKITRNSYFFFDFSCIYNNDFAIMNMIEVGKKMNNNEVRQISEEEIQKELTKEQLQQTQVLNFQEVQKTIHFEKKTSKKPAILIAIVGIICLLFGGTFQIATALNPNPQNIQKRTVKNTITEKTLSCLKVNDDNLDGTTTTYNIIYKFKNEKLVSATKEYDIKVIPGKEEGKQTIEKTVKKYEELLNETPGYSIDTYLNSDTEMKITVKIDYKKLDLTKLNEKQQSNIYTKVDYSKNATYETISEEALEKGFTIE